MYVKTSVELEGPDGVVEEYEVGADVEAEFGGYYVAGPDISAPGCSLKGSRLAPDPQAGGVFPEGWSEIVEEALLSAYVDCVCDSWEPEEKDHV